MTESKGFILLEAIPALLLMVAAMLIAGRVLGYQGRWQVQREVMRDRMEALREVCQAWQMDAGLAAMVARDRRTGEWTVVVLPSEAWLPTPGARFAGDYSPDTRVGFWRRSWQERGGHGGWLIEERYPAESPTWQARTWHHGGAQTGTAALQSEGG